MNYPITIRSSVTAILPAAGIGNRMKAAYPKQYLSVGNCSILEHAINSLLYHPYIQRVIVAIRPGDKRFKELPIFTNPKVSISNGGFSRADSVLSALKLVSDVQWVLIHDAARPCLHPEDLSRLLSIITYSKVGGILAIKARDTMKRAKPKVGTISHTIARKDLWHALTPQLFPLALLKYCMKRVLDEGLTITDEASALEYCGYYPLLISGRSDNIKVTKKEDLMLAKFYLTQLKKIRN